MFAQCLARQIKQVLMALPENGFLLEVGPGRGQLAIDLLQALAAEQCLPTAYYLYDISPALQKIQQERLSAALPPELYQRVVWLNDLSELRSIQTAVDPMLSKTRGIQDDAFQAPDISFSSGVILANEVLDAMPVQRFRVGESGVDVCYVDWVDHQFVDVWVPLSSLSDSRESQAIKEALRAVPIDTLPLGYQSEVNVGLSHWLSELVAGWDQGMLLLIDYGFPSHEYYHPDRAQGTLMCHYRHRAHSNPYQYLGTQDITAHVDFTAVANAACDVGLQVAGFSHQAAFLVNCGLADVMMQANPTHNPLTADHLPVDHLAAQFKRNQAVKLLTLPSEMGELFKVMALTRGLDQPWLGFSAMNALARL